MQFNLNDCVYTEEFLSSKICSVSWNAFSETIHCFYSFFFVLKFVIKFIFIASKFATELDLLFPGKNKRAKRSRSYSQTE